MLLVLLAFAVVVLLVAAVRLTRMRMRDRREQNRELPPLIYPIRGLEEQRASVAAAQPAAPPVGEQVLFNSAAPVAPPVHIVREAIGSARKMSEDADAPHAVAAAPHASAPHAAARNAPDTQSRAAHEVETPAVDPDATLQLLPGRLEPVEPGTEQEIRFVRVSGVKRFTLGRNSGPVHSHIQLRAATASRMHAYMLFEEGRWQLGNMSQTNAVIVNGSALNGEPHALVDGDRIEFGELTFVFRER